MSKFNFSLKKFIIFAITTLIVFTCISLLVTNYVQASHNFNLAVESYKSTTVNLSTNLSSASDLRNLSKKFLSLENNFFLSNKDRQEAANLKDFTKYLSCREDIYSSLTLVTQNQEYFKNPSPNRVQTIVNSLSNNLNNMKTLYIESPFIQSKVTRTPGDLYNFCAYFTSNLSNTKPDTLLKQLDDYFYKELPSSEVLPNLAYNTDDTIPAPSLEELDSKPLKNLKKLTPTYEKLISKTNSTFKNISKDSDTQSINNYFLEWNTNLNSVWNNIRESVSNQKLKELQTRQLTWINSKSNKSKFEQAEMTRERTLLLINLYIYQI